MVACEISKGADACAAAERDSPVDALRKLSLLDDPARRASPGAVVSQ